MSKNAKSARNLRAARAMSKQRKGGSKGPAKTQRLHTKRNTWYNPASSTFWRSRRKQADAVAKG